MVKRMCDVIRHNTYTLLYTLHFTSANTDLIYMIVGTTLQLVLMGNDVESHQS